MISPPDRNLRQLARVFLKLGTIGFGGPAAHIALMEEEVVRRRNWISSETFLDLVGATNLIPGPNSTELAIHIGYLRAGWPGRRAAIVRGAAARARAAGPAGRCARCRRPPAGRAAARALGRVARRAIRVNPPSVFSQCLHFGKQLFVVKSNGQMLERLRQSQFRWLSTVGYGNTHFIQNFSSG